MVKSSGDAQEDNSVMLALLEDEATPRSYQRKMRATQTSQSLHQFHAL
jgi:hypothetical protein